MDTTYTISIHNHCPWNSTKYNTKFLKKKKICPIMSPKLNEDKYMRSFKLITICYVQDDIQNIWIEIV